MPNSKKLKPQPQGNKYKQLADSCAEWIAKGCGIAGTARHHGIDRKTLYFWQEHQHFQELVKQKGEEWRQELLSKIQEAGKEPRFWPANAWLLERSKTFEGEYAQPRSLPAGTANVQINVVIGSPPSEHGQTTVTIGEAPETNEVQSGCQGRITGTEIIDHNDP